MRQEAEIAKSESPVSRAVFERAIMETVLYSDCFDYPLTLPELAHYLMGVEGCKEQIFEILRRPSQLAGKLSLKDDYVTLRGREMLVERRRARALKSRRIWKVARRYVRILSALPFVRMVAVTGALAMDNCDERDDVDVLVATTPSRVWLGRAFAVLVVRAGRLSRNTLCPNYVISQEALCLEPRSVYVAHEFAQMVSLYGKNLHAQMREANPWVKNILPNADKPFRQEAECQPGPLVLAVKRAAERLLSGALGTWLEGWEMRRKFRKFAAMTTDGTAGVRFDRDHVKGHFEDHGTRIAAEYRNRLRAHHLQFPDNV